MTQIAQSQSHYSHSLKLSKQQAAGTEMTDKTDISETQYLPEYLHNFCSGDLPSHIEKILVYN